LLYIACEILGLEFVKQLGKEEHELHFVALLIKLSFSITLSYTRLNKPLSCKIGILTYSLLGVFLDGQNI
jgi:hypothetical protein